MISPSNEYSGLISFRMDWFDLAVEGTLKSLPHLEKYDKVLRVWRMGLCFLWCIYVRISIYFCFIDYAKAFDCVGHNRLWKIIKEM